MRRSAEHRWAWAGAAGISVLAAGAAVQRHHTRRIAADPENEALQNPPRGTDITLRSADGTELHAGLFGPEDGQPVVLVHGWTENIAIWFYVIRELAARGFRIIAVELRGHGASEPAASDDYSMTRFGEDVEAVLDACVPDGQHAVLAGHSLGAMAIVAWAEHNEVSRRVGAIALLNTGIGDLVADHLVLPVPKFAKAINEAVSVHGFLGAPGPMPRVSTPISHFLIRYVAFHRNTSPAKVAFYERMVAACSWRVRADAGITMSKIELHHVLPRLTVPTLVMAGEHDRLTPPSHARRIAGELPQLHKLIILPDIAHMGPLESPEAVSAALTELLGLVRSHSTVAA